MPFPLTVGELVVPHAVGLGYVVAADLRAGGGTVIPDRGVNDWLPEAARGLDPDEQRALVRSLLRQSDAGAISAACAVGLAVRPEGIGPWFLSALAEHDVGTLLMADARGRSAEELLATTGAELCPLDDPRWRRLVLAALRSAGLSRDEAAVLARYGTEAELAEWGPPLLDMADDDVTAAFLEFRDREAVVAALGDELY